MPGLCTCKRIQSRELMLCIELARSVFSNNVHMTPEVRRIEKQAS
jgi:hypothetical protein